MLDAKLMFWAQITGADKLAPVIMPLSRIMANTSGLKPSKCRLLMSVMLSILLYSVEIWAEALKVQKYGRCQQCNEMAHSEWLAPTTQFLMLQSEHHWDHVATYIGKVIRQKK